MRELSLVYLSRLKSTFEVYDSTTKELLGHITFKVKDGKLAGFCFTPCKQPIGQAHPTMEGALCAFFQGDVVLNFPNAIE